MSNIYERLKGNPLLKLIYKFPAADKTYHLLLAWFGALRHGFPSRRLKVIGITGTKGKTSTVEILAAILQGSGRKTAFLSSAHVGFGEEIRDNSLGNTMPGRGFIQKFFADAARAGEEYAVLEVSSQGVPLSRHRFIRWAAAAITNIAPEHIEAHGSFENYRAAKLKFLEKAARQGAPVFINADDERSRFFADKLRRYNNILYSAEEMPELPLEIRQILPGRFNLENVALALSVAETLGVSEEECLSALRKFKGISGRAEYVQREPFKVVVDYAHTPDSLRAIYVAVKENTPGRMICVLGAAGGGRDKWKRPEMGRVAAEHCAEIILTDEDPYDENPQEILQQVSRGFFPNTVYEEILDRREAIHSAIKRAMPGDAVVITGKGSERLIHLANGQMIPWSDREEAEKALRQ